jgi:hypothetical protein
LKDIVYNSDPWTEELKENIYKENPAEEFPMVN